MLLIHFCFYLLKHRGTCTENQGFCFFPQVPKSIMETSIVVLTFESVDEIPWCDHSNEISFTVLSHVLFVWQDLIMISEL